MIQLFDGFNIVDAVNWINHQNMSSSIWFINVKQDNGLQIFKTYQFCIRILKIITKIWWDDYDAICSGNRVLFRSYYYLRIDCTFYSTLDFRMVTFNLSNKNQRYANITICSKQNHKRFVLNIWISGTQKVELFSTWTFVLLILFVKWIEQAIKWFLIETINAISMDADN